MSYDLNGQNGDFVCNNYTMHLFIEKMFQATTHQYEPLWKKFNDNSGRWVNSKWCGVLLKLAIRARENTIAGDRYEDRDNEIHRWDEFIRFLESEVKSNGGFSVN